MNNWLNKLERKYGRYGIPNLTNILVAGQILVLAIELFVDRTISFWLGLSRSPAAAGAGLAGDQLYIHPLFWWQHP